MQKKYTKNSSGGGRRATIESMRKDLMLFFFFFLAYFAKKKKKKWKNGVWGPVVISVQTVDKLVHVYCSSEFLQYRICS